MIAKINALLTSIGGLSGIVTGAIWLDTQFAPLLPVQWQNLITAVFGLFTLYHIGNAVAVARGLGARGL